MLRLLADENFTGAIVKGLLRQRPDLDIVRAQDVGLSGAKDTTILEWAAAEERLLLTHDVKTMTKIAFQRLATGQRMPGIIEIRRVISIREAVEEILVLVHCSHQGEWEGQVVYLPL